MTGFLLRNAKQNAFRNLTAFELSNTKQNISGSKFADIGTYFKGNKVNRIQDNNSYPKEEIWKAFVTPFNAFNHLKEIRTNLREDGKSFPIKVVWENGDITYDFVVEGKEAF